MCYQTRSPWITATYSIIQPVTASLERSVTIHSPRLLFIFLSSEVVSKRTILIIGNLDLLLNMIIPKVGHVRAVCACHRPTNSLGRGWGSRSERYCSLRSPWLASLAWMIRSLGVTRVQNWKSVPGSETMAVMDDADDHDPTVLTLCHGSKAIAAPVQSMRCPQSNSTHA